MIHSTYAELSATVEYQRREIQRLQREAVELRSMVQKSLRPRR